ncbi:TetR/AcrR family transcriptional regulator [Mycolicibacterium sp. P9-64]|uniref:TetR/AcrR family transcriptional regulator n=1 Tax=Mycolicibacterium sp. P9-64 TaxID=2024612 RepID=UPI0011EFB1B4|nr:TetR/AcrR family transcriptional regulator [Mycolicibacterium sp. P9-64]KAA0085621.1 TetR/AcrR family transcriptional regulator [Mycolicibacterium sp. P9-64]
MARTGRPRAFDKDEKLAAALNLFWSRGYAATSVQDLVDALGVERGSIYAAFGDKRDLYLEAVKLYWRQYEVELETAMRSVPLLPALRWALTNPVHLEQFATDLGVPQGCLMGNTSAELLPRDTDAQVIVAHSYQRFVDIVSDALQLAQERGEVVDTAPASAQAQMLLFFVQGFSLVSRAGPDKALSLAAVDAAIDSLRV